jgi:hypothetical protein
VKGFFKKRRFYELSNYYPLFFTIVFVLILIQYSFSSLDAIFYDLWVRFDVGVSKQSDVILISLDEESDEFLGETFPYTYATHLRFMRNLSEDRPTIIGSLFALGDPDSENERRYQADYKKTIFKYQERGGLFRYGTFMDYFGEQVPPEPLRPLGYSLAQINVDNIAFARDDVCRRAILNISGEDSFHLWAANAYRLKNGMAPLDVNSIQGSYYYREADATFTLFRYPINPTLESKGVVTVPFHRVVVGNFPKDFFKGKIVLIGSKYLSNSSDFVLTPFNKEQYTSPQLNIHASIVESLIQDKTVYKIKDVYTDILAVLVALLLSWGISKLKPTRGLALTIGIMLGVFFLGYFLFVSFGLWPNLTHIVLTIFVVYYIWVPFRAIGEYQRRYAFEEEAKLLKKVDSLKQNFISLMSHDLKTPVAKIAGIADILKTQYDNGPAQKNHLDSIINATKELNKFITSILDLTKIESQNLNLRRSTKDINTIIETVTKTLRFEANRNNIKLETELEPLYPITLDVDLINRVISNLVENAIKYSGEGKSVSVRTWDDEKWVYVEIKDDGIGIPEKDLEHIFDKFYRVKNDSVHSIKGSGLGLYLVKYFIELHGGTIKATSKVGEGTTFLVKLKNA